MSTMLAAYVFALLGGVVLNLMPCVLPVLTMKVFHLVEHAHDEPRANRLHGLAYSAGILLFFAAIATVVVVFKAGGERLLWGQQFQSPIFVAMLTALLFGFALNALGVIEFGIGLSVGEASGYKGSLLNGLVAAIMATPCSAPGLGLALPFALNPTTPWNHTVGVFGMIGVGLALPFLLISFIPGVAKVLPKPGAWMVVFKQVMGFSLMAAAIWLFWTLQGTVSRDASTMFLLFLLAIAVAAWAIGNFAGPEQSPWRRRIVQGVAIGLTCVAGYVLLDLTPPVRAEAKLAPTTSTQPADVCSTLSDRPAVVDGRINWEDFDPQLVERALACNRPVFLDFTADWCANCKTNEQLFIETARIREDLGKTGILPVKVDFTSESEVIEQWIEKLGRAGIPIYVILTPDGERDLLPEVITTDLLSQALQRASKAHPPEQFRHAELAQPTRCPD
jgi:thiol:disulfide interchange protein